MKLAKRILIFVLVVALLIGIWFFTVVNFGTVNSSFSCSGTVQTDDGQKPYTVYIKIEEYRRWLILWGESDGNMYLEIPSVTVHHYPDIIDLDPQLQINDWGGKLVGNFSKLSKTLALDTPIGFFDGACGNAK
jgi:hypothetical protein